MFHSLVHHFMPDTRTILPNLIPSPGQVRQARALLRIGQRQLAKAAGIAVTTLNAYEGEQHPVFDSTVVKIRAALEEMGLKFGLDGSVIDGRAPRR